MRLKDLFKPEWWSERLYREEWNIGIVDQTAEEIVQHGFRSAPRWLPRAERAMQADPSCLPFEDGRLLLMAEHMDYRSGRGEIWSAVVPAGSKLDSLAFYPWLAGTCHLSYPFPFVDARGRRCLTVESAEADGLFLWREDGGKWILSGSILPDLPAIDATLWRDSERWWLFCGLRNDLPNERLYLYHAEKPEGPWSPHRANPVKRWREDIAWMAYAGERAPKSARNVKSRLLGVRDGRSVRPGRTLTMTRCHRAHPLRRPARGSHHPARNSATVHALASPMLSTLASAAKTPCLFRC